MSNFHLTSEFLFFFLRRVTYESERARRVDGYDIGFFRWHDDTVLERYVEVMDGLMNRVRRDEDTLPNEEEDEGKIKTKKCLKIIVILLIET